MIQIKRRQFLQGAGAALATLGFTQLELQQHSLRYAKVLAQSTPRKRALLVGISDYLSIREGSGWGVLPGAVNDVEMQRELLVHRFGFQSSDVRCLKNEKAKRENILGELNDLIQWAKPGDVVVIHYSGHGSTVDDPDHVFKEDNLNGTLVPWDSDWQPNGGEVNDITAGTLFLLIRALKTENVTIVLDSCYAGGGTRGNLVIRARPGQAELLLRGNQDGAKLFASQQERDYQTQKLAEQKLSRATWIQERQHGLAKGVALVAAQRNQEAADATFAGDAHAGVFTYALTRYLWQQTQNESMGTVLVAAKAKTERLLSTMDGKKHSQTPEFQEKPNSGNQQKPTYFLSDFAAKQGQAAEAVVTQVEGNEVQILLNGVEPQVLETFGKGARLTLVNAKGEAIDTVEITERNQLRAKGTVKLKTSGQIAPGALLQERSRLIPPDWTLRIGLDPSLGSEAAIAKAELPKIQARIEPVPLLQQEVHYILGRMTQPVYDALQQRKLPNVPTVGSLGLFYSGLEILPDSFGKPGESVKKALEQRLQPKFKFLLAGRLLKLMLNPISTRLNVKAAVKVAGSKEFAAQVIAVRGGQNAPLVAEASAKQIRVGEPIQIVVENNEPKDLHCAIVFLSADGEVQPLPFTSIVPTKTAIVLPGDKGKVTVEPPLGVAEVMVVFSTTSLDQAIAQLQILSEARGDDRGEKAVATVDTLLDDLAGTRGGRDQPQERRLDPQQMAALSVTFEIVGGSAQ